MTDYDSIENSIWLTVRSNFNRDEFIATKPGRDYNTNSSARRLGAVELWPSDYALHGCVEASCAKSMRVLVFVIKCL
jgi:hypothetical protein